MPDTQRRMVFHSNAAWAGTGYGNQVRTFLPLLHAAGWEVFVSCFWGLQGAPLKAEHATFLPASLDQWGNDVLESHYKRYRPDVMFHLHDIWVLRPAVLRAYPAASWCPVDHQPLPPAVRAGLEACRWPVAMSRFGEREMRAAGLTDVQYIPHGYNTDVFKPMDRAQARAAWGVDEDAFFAVVVAANKGNPSRKSLDRILKAWAKFVPDHPGAVLYVHSLATGAHGGWDLLTVAQHYGIPSESIRVPDMYRYVMGEYTWEALAQLYNAADVKISTSMGEGFGITEIEAQGCGCPVIVTDFSAQSELCFGGYKVPVDDFDDLTWTFQDSEQAFVRPSGIVNGLVWAWEQRGNAALRQQAVDGARAYGAEEVFARYMRPVLEHIADVNAQERAETTPVEAEAELAPA